MTPAQKPAKKVFTPILPPGAVPPRSAGRGAGTPGGAAGARGRARGARKSRGARGGPKVGRYGRTPPRHPILILLMLSPASSGSHFRHPPPCCSLLSGLLLNRKPLPPSRAPFPIPAHLWRCSLQPPRSRDHKANPEAHCKAYVPHPRPPLSAIPVYRRVCGSKSRCTRCPRSPPHTAEVQSGLCVRAAVTNQSAGSSANSLPLPPSCAAGDGVFCCR